MFNVWKYIQMKIMIVICTSGTLYMRLV